MDLKRVLLGMAASVSLNTNQLHPVAAHLLLHPPAPFLLQVLGEDLVLVKGQQDRMSRGAGAKQCVCSAALLWPRMGRRWMCAAASKQGQACPLGPSACMHCRACFTAFRWVCPFALLCPIPYLHHLLHCLQMCGPTQCRTISWGCGTGAGATRVRHGARWLRACETVQRAAVLCAVPLTLAAASRTAGCTALTFAHPSQPAFAFILLVQSPRRTPQRGSKRRPACGR